MRLTFVLLNPFGADGTAPVSAITGEGAIDILDQPVLEILAHGPKVGGHPQGLEITQLRLEPAALLADAYMMAMTHGAMFHVAAAEHFAGRDESGDHVGAPKFPGFPVGAPRPADVGAASPLGVRLPLTTPPGGGPPAREAGIGFRAGFQSFSIDYEGRMSGQIVDG